MRKVFEEQLALLNQELVRMGKLCEESIAASVKALIEAESELLLHVRRLDVQVRDKAREIESMCMRLLLQQQPVAKDLRQVSASLKMVTDMERIGVQSAEIAEIVSMDRITALDETHHIHEMALGAIRMVTDSVEAFVGQDMQLAESVIAYDDVLDHAFDEAKAALAKHFAAPGSSAEKALDFLMIAKYLERIGDHAVNIAQWVIYLITGENR